MKKSKINMFLEDTGPGILPAGAVTIVMGNEASDLDSMASAVLYAYYLSLEDPSCNPKALINIPRGDFKLRTEATFLFNEAGIDESVLNFSSIPASLKRKVASVLSLKSPLGMFIRAFGLQLGSSKER